MVNGATLKLVRDQVRLMYKDNHTGLGDFGVKPYRDRAPLTNDVLLVRAEKAKATRVKRGTKGKRQKAAIRGDVTGVVIEPIVAGATEAKGEPSEKVW
jgi:hypothetical protein